MSSSKVAPAAAIATDDVFDILRGIAELTENRVVKQLADAVARHPEAPFGNAFNHKQIACKRWLVSELPTALPGTFEHVLVVGGWLGILSALLFDRMPAQVRRITTLDIDPGCAAVAETVNLAAHAEGRFRAVTADMRSTSLDVLADGWPPIDLVVNTSVEHLSDVRGWLDTLPARINVILQSNDYIREPEHVSSVPDLGAFKQQAKLSEVAFEGALKLKHYTRFMLIGRV